jgi:uncharacterized protein YcfJ
MKPTIRMLFGGAAAIFSLAATAEVVFYDNEGFRGRAFTATGPLSNLERSGFNDRAASAVVSGGRWEVCTDANFGGECRILRSGSYESLNGMGLGDRISSVRPAGGRRSENLVEAPPPLPAPNYEYRQRPSERLYEARVTSARAVYGANEQRCWVDRERVSEGGKPNVGGAILGGIIGGVLGHQVGGGRGNDVATGIGAVGGAAIGANQGRSDGRTYSQDVQRCSEVPGSSSLQYWDVEYVHNGQTHRVQMAQSPGPTVTVNRSGEPRG